MGREGQLRRPLVARRHVEVDHAVISQLGGGVDGLRLVVVAVGVGFGLRMAHIHVVDRELVGEGGQVALEAFAVVLIVEDARTQVERQGKLVVEETLVDRQQGVGVEVVVVDLVVLVVAVFGSEQLVGRGIDLARIVHHHVIGAHAPREGDPVGNVPLERGVERIAVRRILEQLAVGDPPGVLDAGDELQGPELLHIARRGVVTLVNLVLGDVVAAREEVNGNQRVVVEALHERVTLVLAHVGSAQVERQLVLDELRGIAEGKVVPVVDVVGDDAARIERSGREIGLVHARTTRNRDRIGLLEAGLEEIRGVVRGRGRELRTPAHGRCRSFGAVGVLELRHDERRRKGGIVGVVHAHTPLLALFGRDDDHAVGTLRTVERGRRGARKHRHGFDVLGVEVRDTLEIAAVGRFVGALGLRRTQVGHRDTVDHIEGVVVAADGLHAAHHHARGTAHARGAGVDLKAGDLARKRVHEVGVLDRVDDVARDLLHVVGQRFLRPFDAEGGNHHGVEHFVVLVHDHRQRGGSRDGKLLFGIADERNFERVPRFGLRKREIAVDVGGGTGRRTFDKHGGADQGHALIVLYDSGNAALSAVGGGIFSFLREHDVFVPKGISDVGAREELVQHGLQRFVVHREAHFAVGVDVRRIVDERTARLLLDSLENRDDRRVRGIEAHTREGLLRLCCGRGGAEASQEQHRDNEQTTETCSDNTSSPACRKVSFFHGSDFRLV